MALTAPVFAQQPQSFSDVPPDHEAYEAAEFLRSQQIIKGYDDGTFKPDKQVNRAEALKIIISPLIDQAALDQVKETLFKDIPEGAWFMSYVEAARQNGIIDGPPKKLKFNGDDTIITAEFLKIMQLANRIDPEVFLGELDIPLSTDVADVSAWFYPYIRYAFASSMIMINLDGLIHPEYQLTRGDTALLMHRFMMYQQERRTQALLSEAEQEMIITLSMLDQGNITQAEFAANRALVAARGAHAKRSEEPIVKGAVKITEAFIELTKGYRKGSEEKYNDVITHCGNAWNLATRAKELSPNLLTIADQVQNISKKMADSARTLKAQQ
ncbi:MAG: S-layer homology domain-containing protein [Candidatus Peribacteraceae bacterium]|nr:S-layer homology domain-containing protein [Candidatus Peribacteraceae bacterium]MDP7454782.1 S-layer homology domain-containing protein [Candidatus Peribacteraceae bacterium]MDP7646115.1 S-layer homology domain-containing protein [Candidatus Peribacteraceae bacterium]